MQERLTINDEQRAFTLVYNDFLECKLLTGYEKLLIIMLRRYGNNAFPSLSKLSELSGFSKSTVQRNLISLQDKGILNIINRSSDKKGNESNLYVLNDNALMWKAKDVDEMALLSGLKNVLLKTSRSVEKYTMSEVRTMYEYNTLMSTYPEDRDWIDLVITTLYDVLNDKRETIRVDKQDKPTEVVRAKLIKLKYDDIMYAISKVKAETNKIVNQRNYLLTILYHAKEQSILDIHNQVKHDLGY